MRRLLLGLLLACWSTLALAQGCGPTNPNCVVPDRPVGDSTNSAADTRFVQNSNFLHSKAFGATGNGVTDDTANLQSWITDIQNTGIPGFLDAGTYKISSALNVTASIRIEGAGDILSFILLSSTTQNGFNITTTSPVYFYNFQITATGPQTAGACILINPASGEANGIRIQNMLLNNCWNGVDFERASGFFFGYNRVFETVNDGVIVRNLNNADSGDSVIIANNFQNSPTPGAIGIYQETSGGLKITSNKINNIGIGYELNVATGVFTSDLILNDNSIEGCSTDCILLTTQTPADGQFRNVQIVGNEFLGLTGATIVKITASGHPLWILGVTIDANTMNVNQTGSGGCGVCVDNSTGVIVSHNYIENLQGSAGTGISFTAAANLGQISKNVFRDFTATAPNISNASTSTITDTISVLDFGAKCDGSTDDTALIQNAINSFPANTQGIVTFPQGEKCKITGALTIGNGTTSAVSTKPGVLLVGQGIPNTAAGTPFGNGYPVSAGPGLIWGGGINQPMIQVNGPIQGWGVQNLYLDCNSVAGTTGVAVQSGQYGDNANLTIVNCPGNGIFSGSNPLGGYTGVGNVDSIRNYWRNINILIPPTTSAMGIKLTGDTGGTSDTDYNVFSNVFLRLNGGPSSGNSFGLVLQVTDNNLFQNISVSCLGTNCGNATGVTFDYTANSVFPGGSVFSGGIEPGSYINLGVPAAGARPNIVLGIAEANSNKYPNLANTDSGLPLKIGPDISLTGQTAAIGATTFYTTYQAGMYRACWDAAATAVGTAGTYQFNLNWNDGNARSFGSTTINTTAALASNYTAGCQNMEVAAAQNIQYVVQFAGVAGGFTYNLNITLERLN